MTAAALARYYNESYPPSVWAPAAVPSTGATAGIPGAWTPAGSQAPASVAALIAAPVVATPATAWTTGQYVQTLTAGAAGRATWGGAAWIAGVSPLAAIEPEPQPEPEPEPQPDVEQSDES